MDYGCRDVAINLRQHKFKSHRVLIPYIMSAKSFRTEVRSRKQKERKEKSIMKFKASGKVYFVFVASLLFDVIGRLYPKEQE